MPQKVFRLTIQLSEFELRKLIVWSKLKARPRAAYAGQIVAARVEANLDLINQMLADEAKFQGVSAEELELAWLQEEGFYTTTEVGIDDKI